MCLYGSKFTSSGFPLVRGTAKPCSFQAGTTSSAGGTVPATLKKRFHGSAALDPARAGRDASRIADEVIAHLVSLVGSEVTVTLEIEAKVMTGIPENVVRTVTENCRTLRFDTQGFERE